MTFTPAAAVVASRLVRRSPAAFLLPVLLWTGALPLTAEPPRDWRLDTDRSRIVVHVDASGLLSPFLKDHHFTPDEWSGRLSFDPEQPETLALEVVVAVESLRNLQTDLSAEDHETVARQVRGPDVLYVEQYPRVRFTADRLAITERATENGMQVVSGTLHGELTIRDHTKPVEIPLSARWSHGWLRAAGQTSFLQTDFGIEPYRRALGTIAVADRLRVEIEIEATLEATESDQANDAVSDLIPA